MMMYLLYALNAATVREALGQPTAPANEILDVAQPLAACALFATAVVRYIM